MIFLLLMGIFQFEPLKELEKVPVQEQLIKRDLAFAEQSRKVGYVEAFQSFVFPNGILFDPGPTHLDTWVKRRSNATGKLDWHPDRVGVSLGGDMGYTSGPWVYSSKDGNKVFGHYVTVWQLRDKDTYLAIADIGIQYPHAFPEAKQNKEAQSCSIPSFADDSTTFEEEKRNLESADQNFNRSILNKGAYSTYEIGTDFELKWFVNGRTPIQGQLSVLDILKSGETPLKQYSDRELLGFDLAESREFGYTFGKLNRMVEGEPSPSYYLRIWKKSYDGSWLIALEVIE